MPKVPEMADFRDNFATLPCVRQQPARGIPLGSAVESCYNSPAEGCAGNSRLRRFGETSVAIGNTAVARSVRADAGAASRLRAFLSRYFYLTMSLVMMGLVVWGFSRTVDVNLFHASPPRPFLLWLHGAAFSTWLIFFASQSALVSVRRVSVHRLLGWFGAGLAALMVPLGVVIAVIMARFDMVVLHQKNTDAFLSIPFYDMILFGTCVGLAISWRKQPELHRRLLFIATCSLMDAAIGRFDFWFNHNLFFPFLDGLIILGAVRDQIVDGRIHKVYLYALPPMMAAQALAVYMWRGNPAWWQGITHAILGL